MRKMLGVLGIALSLTVMMGAADAWARRGDKVALIDLRRIWIEYKGMRDVVEQLKKETSEHQAEIDAQKQEVAKLREDYENKSVILSDSEKEKKSEEIDTKIKKLQEYVININKELKTLDMRLREKVINDVKKVVTSVGDNKGYDLILNNSEAFVLFSKKGLDITDEVLQELASSYGV